ncbi:MAG TPA: 5-oxoprolinase subunit PxpB [Bacillota bacterium]|nr:5-oxoprolinase subunit PxpB [Bacillota bacterium]
MESFGVSRVIRPSGDAALLVELGDRLAPEVAQRVRAMDAAVATSGLAGLRERVPGYTTLLCEYDPLRVDVWALAERLAALRRAVLAESAGSGGQPGRQVRVPVAYGGAFGPDVAEVAALHGLSEAEVIERHAGRRYLVYFLGFSPGFAYMGEVDGRIATPRRAPPRTRVPEGSVAMAAAMTGVYPAATPGGWRILGRTPWPVYDPGAAEPALFRQGDEVSFEPISAAAFQELAAAKRPVALPEPWDGQPAFHVVRPGPLTTFQDLGRAGHQAIGVPVAGAADPPALRLANRLVGNPDSAAALEITVMGPTLAAVREVAVALCGADLGASIEGERLPPGQVALLQRGQELRFRGPVSGCRCYLAVAGGFLVPPVFGSASADLLGRLGPRPLQAGDELFAAEAAPRAVKGRRLRPGAYTLPPAGELEVAVVPGPQEDWFAEAERFYGGAYGVLPASDRTGLRLDGAAVQPRAGELLSEATPLGSIQVPSDGKPIVLLAGRQTVGGYAKIGVVCTPDVWRLAQVRPGAARLRFRPVGLAEAHAHYRAALLDDGAVQD